MKGVIPMSLFKCSHKYEWEYTPKRILCESLEKSRAVYKCRRCGKVKYKIEKCVYKNSIYVQDSRRSFQNELQELSRA